MPAVGNSLSFLPVAGGVQGDAVYDLLPGAPNKATAGAASHDVFARGLYEILAAAPRSELERIVATSRNAADPLAPSELVQSIAAALLSAAPPAATRAAAPATPLGPPGPTVASLPSHLPAGALASAPALLPSAAAAAGPALGAAPVALRFAGAAPAIGRPAVSPDAAAAGRSAAPAPDAASTLPAALAALGSGGAGGSGGARGAGSAEAPAARAAGHPAAGTVATSRELSVRARQLALAAWSGHPGAAHPRAAAGEIDLLASTRSATGPDGPRNA